MRFTAAPATVATLVQEVDPSLVREFFCFGNFLPFLLFFLQFFAFFIFFYWSGEKSEVQASGSGDKDACLRFATTFFGNILKNIEMVFGRCGTKVFLMDMVRGKSGLYHKQCLNCATCKLVLTFTILSRTNSMIDY